MLKEQVVTPRAGRGGAAKGKSGGQQRPVRRQNRSSAAKSGAARVNWRALAPVFIKGVLAVLVGVVFFSVYRTTASSSFFAVRAVDVSGATRASKDDLASLARRAAAQSGVWDADLNALSAELERQPWIRSAVVSRVLPSGLRVRVSERVPRVVARAANGRLAWIDDDGVLVSQVSPDDELPAFFMRGWDATAETDAARADNRRRVTKFLELLRELESEGVARRVSELNLDDWRDVRAQLAGGDAEVEVRLGREDYTTRLRNALTTLDAQRSQPHGPYITHLDMTRGKSAVIGLDRATMQRDRAARDREAEKPVTENNNPPRQIRTAGQRDEGDESRPKRNGRSG